MASSGYKDECLEGGAEEETGEGEREYCWECQNCGLVVESPYLYARETFNCCDNRDMLEIAGRDDRRVPAERGKLTVYSLYVTEEELDRRMTEFYRGMINMILRSPKLLVLLEERTKARQAKETAGDSGENVD